MLSKPAFAVIGLAAGLAFSAFTSCRKARTPEDPAASPAERPPEGPTGPAIFPPGPPPSVQMPGEPAPVVSAPPVAPGPIPVKASATQPNPPRLPSRCFLVEVKARGGATVAEVPCPR